MNTALFTGKSPIELPRCIHRTTDERPSTDPDDKRMTVWLSVHQLTSATIGVSGSATGEGTGTLSITLLRDGTPIAHSPEIRGSKSILASTGAKVVLAPGRQYQISARPTVRNKYLGLFRMDVGIGMICP